MIDLIFMVLVAIHSSAIALGVGASTLAITGFLTAISDGNIDEGERRIMGVIYVSLRVAMVSIVLAAILILLMRPEFFGAYTWPQWVMVAALFINAVLMTKHWISPKFGPAIQAGTWYSLGILITLFIFDLVVITPTMFAIFYASMLVAAVIIVNGCMAYLKSRRKNASGQ